jgi:two-component system, sensor histidine kinase and response regulator
MRRLSFPCRCTSKEPIRAPVLIVEDDEDMAGGVNALLAQAGYDACVASNGFAALEHLRRYGKPSIILLDLHMPVMDGIQMMQVLQSEPEWRRIPVVLLTGDSEVRDKSLAVRALGYLKKPIGRRDLLAMVDSALRYPT